MKPLKWLHPLRLFSGKVSEYCIIFKVFLSESMIFPSLSKGLKIFYTERLGWQVPAARPWTRREHAGQDACVCFGSIMFFTAINLAGASANNVYTQSPASTKLLPAAVAALSTGLHFKTPASFPLWETRSFLCTCMFLTMQDQKHGWKLSEKWSFPSNRGKCQQSYK